MADLGLLQVYLNWKYRNPFSLILRLESISCWHSSATRKISDGSIRRTSSKLCTLERNLVFSIRNKTVIYFWTTNKFLKVSELVLPNSSYFSKRLHFEKATIWIRRGAPKVWTLSHSNLRLENDIATAEIIWNWHWWILPLECWIPVFRKFFPFSSLVRLFQNSSIPVQHHCRGSPSDLP